MPNKLQKKALHQQQKTMMKIVHSKKRKGKKVFQVTARWWPGLPRRQQHLRDSKNTKGKKLKLIFILRETQINLYIFHFHRAAVFYFLLHIVFPPFLLIVGRKATTARTQARTRFNRSGAAEEE